MVTFQYLSFACDADELEARLNELGSQGWRLHTCEPVVTVGPSGSGTLHAFVVMDKATADIEATVVREMPHSEGIPMKG